MNHPSHLLSGCSGGLGLAVESTAKQFQLLPAARRRSGLAGLQLQQLLAFAASDLDLVQLALVEGADKRAILELQRHALAIAAQLASRRVDHVLIGGLAVQVDPLAAVTLGVTADLRGTSRRVAEGLCKGRDAADDLADGLADLGLLGHGSSPLSLS